MTIRIIEHALFTYVHTLDTRRTPDLPAVKLFRMLLSHEMKSVRNGRVLVDNEQL